ncbi:TonB-dependent vitamin B12 receptor [Vibrio palustris]|uniref:Vitamin B12 transporter BtuB n=1 Tax=Vibrio palustris TaxID=1918946 RepID=A0A1R4B878_9VIBR|nr:TonB-dependent vitamin B12 receptor [Vibrio palustris]SJL85130.1 Vitamin B12 transporter BtuB precursor [Vibrio palustris]
MNKSLLVCSVAALLCASVPSHAKLTPTSMDTVIVTANRFPQQERTALANIDVITRRDIEQSQAKSLPDVLCRLTGVQISQNGGRGQLASLYVRGTGPSQVLVLMDGVRLARSAKGAVDFNQIPLNYVDHIEYVRGAKASLYGSEAIGGVINIITVARSRQQITKVNVGLGSLDYKQIGGSTGVATSENGQLNMAVSHEADDGYNVHPVPGINDGDKHGFKSNNGLVGYTHDVTEQLSLFANGRLFKNTYQYDSSFGSRQYMEAEKEDQSWTLGGAFNGQQYRSLLQFNYQQQKQWDYQQKLGKASSGATKDRVTQSVAKWSNSFEVNQGLTLAGGVDWRQSGYKNLQTNREYTRDNTAVYALVTSDIDQLRLQASGRIDDNEAFGQDETYNIAAGYRFIPELALRASYGTGIKAPNLYELYDPTYGNEGLTPETSKSYELGVYGRVYDVYWSVTGYDNKITNLLSYDPSTYVSKNINGQSHIKGIEVEANFRTGIVDHQLSADIKSPKDKDGKQLVRRSRQIYKWNTTTHFDDIDWVVSYMWFSRRPTSTAHVDLASYALVNTSINYYVTKKVTLSGRIANLLDKEYATAAGYPAAERAYYMNMGYQF